MSQERWDIVLRFLSGPLSFRGDSVWRGPVVRLGSNPGAGGVVLDGYRGLDDRQAVITAYDGTNVTLAPVGNNQVRVATHENVDWDTIRPIRDPVSLSPGDAFHLGSTERGVSVVFLEARRLGVWEEQNVLSEAAGAHPHIEPTEVKALDANQGVPRWFVPGVVVVGLVTVVGIVVYKLLEGGGQYEPLGAQVAGEEFVERVDEDVEVDDVVLEGLRGPFQDFVMRPNADAAGDPNLLEPENWDQRFFEFVTRSVVVHARAQRFWARLEEIREDYAFVVEALRDADMPEVFAAIPYHESQYRSSNQSPACAEGYWQFQPETANRVDLEVGTCQYTNNQGTYDVGSDIVLPRNALQNATYIERSDGNYRCRIRTNGCTPDERRDLELSTLAAIRMFEEPMSDPMFTEYGVAVQSTILTHIAGYDDARFEGEGASARAWNVLPAFERFIDRNGEAAAIGFYGESITCLGEEYSGLTNYNSSCGGVLLNAAQHYAYSIVATHFLAVCYYAKNYGGEDSFRSWRRRYEDEYCSTISIPTAEQAQQWGGQ